MVTKRAKLWLTRGATIGVLAAVVVFLVGTWLQAGTVEADWLTVSHETPAGAAVVVSVEPNSVILRDEGGADLPGVWGLVFDGGRAVVGEVESISGSEVRRVLLEVSGGLTPGTEVSFDVAVWGSDARERLGLVEATADGSGGPLPVWTASGEDDTWVVFVHGNGARSTEALRLVPVVTAAGYPVVVASYRNDPGTVAAPDGRHGYGRDEWQDLDAVLNFALGQGALDFVLVGYGSGGSIVGTHLYESRLAERVVGVVLDSPMLSLRTAIHDKWVERGVPAWTIGWAKGIASMRFGLDLGAIDHVERSSEWEVSTLLFHGRDEAASSLDAVEAFAIARGDEALLLTFPGAGPGASWNSDPTRYEAAVIGFLDQVAAERSEFEPVDPG
ncbi:MAG: hypothetical protein V3W36_05435 [Acidimicrobiia bacterium]|jgi:alpha-beta hydrolase superfamily lysophospholipase